MADQDVAPSGGMSGEPPDEIPYIEGEESIQEESAAAVFGDQSMVENSWDYDDDDDEDEEGEEVEDSQDSWLDTISNPDVREYVEARGYKSMEDAIAGGMQAQSFVGQQGSEVGQLRAEIDSLRAQLQDAPKPASAEQEERANIVRNAPQLRADIYRMVDEGEMDMEQAGGRLEALNEIVMQDRLEQLENKFESKFSEVNSTASALQQQTQLDDAVRDVAEQLGDLYDEYSPQALEYVENYLNQNPGAQATPALVKEAYGQVALQHQAQQQRRAAARVTGEGAASGAARQAPVDPAKAIRRAIKGKGRSVSGGFS